MRKTIIYYTEYFRIVLFTLEQFYIWKKIVFFILNFFLNIFYFFMTQRKDRRQSDFGIDNLEVRSRIGSSTSTTATAIRIEIYTRWLWSCIIRRRLCRFDALSVSRCLRFMNLLKRRFVSSNTVPPSVLPPPGDPAMRSCSRSASRDTDENNTNTRKVTLNYSTRSPRSNRSAEVSREIKKARIRFIFRFCEK